MTGRMLEWYLGALFKISKYIRSLEWVHYDCGGFVFFEETSKFLDESIASLNLVSLVRKKKKHATIGTRQDSANDFIRMRVLTF